MTDDEIRAYIDRTGAHGMASFDIAAALADQRMARGQLEESDLAVDLFMDTVQQQVERIRAID